MNSEESFKMKTVQVLWIWIFLLLWKNWLCVFRLCSFGYSAWSIHSGRACTFRFHRKGSFTSIRLFGLISFHRWLHRFWSNWFFASGASAENSAFLLFRLLLLLILPKFNIDEIIRRKKQSWFNGFKVLMTNSWLPFSIFHQNLDYFNRMFLF